MINEDKVYIKRGIAMTKKKRAKKKAAKKKKSR